LRPELQHHIFFGVTVDECAAFHFLPAHVLAERIADDDAMGVEVLAFPETFPVVTTCVAMPGRFMSWNAGLPTGRHWLRIGLITHPPRSIAIRGAFTPAKMR
jgi:hypothetical protein